MSAGQMAHTLGECQKVAETKEFETGLALCAGFNNKLKWRTEGIAFLAIEAIAFIESFQANYGFKNGKYKIFIDSVVSPLGKIEEKCDPMNKFFSTINLKKSIELSTAGKARWDDLLTSMYTFIESQEVSNRASNAWIDAVYANSTPDKKDNLTYQEIAQLKKSLDQAQANEDRSLSRFIPQMQLFESYLLNKVGLENPLDAARAFFEIELKKCDISR